MTGNVTLETRHEPIPNVRNRIGRSPGRKKNTVRYRRGYAVAVPESAPCVVSCQRYRNASAAADAVAADTMHRYSSIADPLASDEDAVYCVPAQRRGCRSFFSAQSRHRRQKKTSPNAGRPNRPKTVNSKGAPPPSSRRSTFPAVQSTNAKSRNGLGLELCGLVASSSLFISCLQSVNCTRWLLTCILAA